MSEFVEGTLPIEDKVDHPQRVKDLEGILSKYFYSSSEFNLLKRAIIENFTDKLAKGNFQGTAEDLYNKIETLTTGSFGPITPATAATFTTDGFAVATTPGDYVFAPGTANEVTINVTENELKNTLLKIDKKGTAYSKNPISLGFTIPDATQVVPPSLTAASTEAAGAKASYIDLYGDTVNKLNPAQYQGNFIRNNTTGALDPNANYQLSNRFSVTTGKTYRRTGIASSRAWYKFKNNVYVGVLQSTSTIAVDDTFNQLETVFNGPQAFGTEMVVIDGTDTTTYIPYSVPTTFKKEKYDFFERSLSPNKLNPAKYQGNYVRNSVTGELSGVQATYTLSNRIDVANGEVLKKTNLRTDFTYYKFKDNVYVGASSTYPIPPGDSTFNQLEFVLPKPLLGMEMVTLNDVDTAIYIPYYDKQVIKPSVLPTTSETVIINRIKYWESLIGSVRFQPFITDIIHFFITGQSLSTGFVSDKALTTIPVNGCIMMGSRVADYNGTTFNPLVAEDVIDATNAENPIIAAINSFKSLYDRHYPNNNIQFLVTSIGQPNQSIERLSKNSPYSTVYYNRVTAALSNAKSIADSLGKTISCGGIVMMQGEANYMELPSMGFPFGEDATNDKLEYKALLHQYRTDFFADIFNTYPDQTGNPVWFQYQTAGVYIENKTMSINIAQQEFVSELRDAVLIGPSYFTPDYVGGHLDANGYRWFGEQIGKMMYKLFVLGIKPESTTIKNVRIISNKVYLDCLVPVLPLTFDDKITQAQTSRGFTVYKDGSAVSLANVEIIENQIILTASVVLTGTIEILYAGLGRNGAGNVRDSDNWGSYYLYEDISDTAAPDYEPTPSLIGKPYPLQNWLNHYYKSITVNS